MNWKFYKENRKDLAKQYIQRYSGIPQDPHHHPEGDVLTHVRLVRKAIPKAVIELNKLKNDSFFGNILANINFEVNPEESEILALSAWLHDVGKATATTIGGKFWKDGKEGRIQAIGHENPNHFKPEIEELGKVAGPETVQLYLKNQQLIDFLIEHHMDFTSGNGFSKKFVSQNFQNGQINGTIEMKLLLILMWADKMGRKPDETIMAAIGKNADNLKLSSLSSSIKSQRIANQKSSFSGTPEQLANLLRSKGVDKVQATKALVGKFPHLSSDELNQLFPECNFRSFFEASQMIPTQIPANIPVPKEVVALANVLKHGDSNVQVYIVGGAVRDYLYHDFHGDKSKSYKPKDVDLTTNLSEDEILFKLKSAAHLGIKVKEKESVDTFGVVFASVNGSETYEIAPFRKDVGIADGRRPEKVERGTIHDDAMRRDLTINNLYYDFENGIILDYNPNGQGIKDVQSKTARMVRDPSGRINEDKLRILRLVRFFSRFNPGRIIENLDNQTKSAINEFKYLYQHKGITPERIYMEFASGLKQSINTANYLHNYQDLDLFKSVFPNMTVDTNSFEQLGNIKNPRVVLAWILKLNSNVDQKLNWLKYPNEISTPVQFLIDVMKFGRDQAIQMIKNKDKSLIRLGKKKTFLTPEEESTNQRIAAEMHEDLTELSKLMKINNSNPEQIKRIDHLRSYQAPQISGDDLMKAGLKGQEIGIEQNKRLQAHYDQSYNQWS